MTDKIENKIKEITENKPLVKFRSKVAMFFKSKKRLIILLSILFVVLLALGITFLPSGYESISDIIKQSRDTVPTSTSSPRPIPTGPKGFTVSQSDKNVPQFGKGTINPYDPAKNANQTVTIGVKFGKPVTSVSAILKTDKKTSKPITFTLVSGTNTDGTWQGSWKMNDTYFYTYSLSLEAVSEENIGSITITLR